jgi:hypothetical protein
MKMFRVIQGEGIPTFVGIDGNKIIGHCPPYILSKLQ